MTSDGEQEYIKKLSYKKGPYNNFHKVQQQHAASDLLQIRVRGMRWVIWNFLSNKPVEEKEVGLRGGYFRYFQIRKCHRGVAHGQSLPRTRKSSPLCVCVCVCV